MKNVLSQSKDMTREYCATVVQIGDLTPIENSDFLATVMVEGLEIVVRKDMVKTGSYMIYVANECQIDPLFLSANNQYSDIELNSNYQDVYPHLERMRKQGATEEEIQAYLILNKGYFGKNGRVRMKKIRGVVSQGFLISPYQMGEYEADLEGFDWAAHLGEDFDMVGERQFVKPYIPEVKGRNGGAKKGRHEKQIKKYDRMIAGQFAFHYDTEPLQRSMERIKPNTSVTITVKEHGSSGIFGNVKVHKPKYGGLYEKLFVYLPKFLQFTIEEYDVIYSSRSVIKNQNMIAVFYQKVYAWWDHITRTLRSMFKKKKNKNPDVPEPTFWEKFKSLFRFKYGPAKSGGFYGVDIWETYYKILKDFIPKGMTFYGEICGYVTNSISGIQSLGGKVYDYGCRTGENRLMIYRIKHVTEEGEVFEFNIQDVYDYTVKTLIPAIEARDKENGTNYAERIKPITILYNGLMKDLYPDLDIANHWHESVLARMKKDKNFGMEENEPMCKNILPREGIVLRINDDPLAEAFKLKCLKFLGKEAEDMDKGITSDLEMQERYSEQSENEE